MVLNTSLCENYCGENTVVCGLSGCENYSQFAAYIWRIYFVSPANVTKTKTPNR